MNTLIITITILAVSSLLHAMTMEYEDTNNLTDFQEVKQIIKQLSCNDLNEISKLTISHTDLQDPSWIKHLKNIKCLDLSYNLIKDIPCLDHNTKLEALNLSHNAISNVTNVFSINIKYLDLSYNLISGDIVLGNGEASFLKGINLSFNQITGILNDVEFLCLKSINLSHNPLASLPDLRRCIGLENVICSFTDIDSLKNITQVKSIKAINATNCHNLKDISYLFFKREGSAIVECVLPELSVFNVSIEFLDDKSKDLINDILEGYATHPMYINDALIIPLM